MKARVKLLLLLFLLLLKILSLRAVNVSYHQLILESFDRLYLTGRIYEARLLTHIHDSTSCTIILLHLNEEVPISEVWEVLLAAVPDATLIRL